MISLAITDTMRPPPSFEQYLEWVKRVDPDIETVRLSCTLNNASELERCTGLILTGGSDVHPGRYDREDALPEVEDVIEQRDEFEFALIDKALELGQPVLAICRGMQLFNVFHRGSLIPDIEKAGYPSHRKGPEGMKRHGVRVEPGTQLNSILGTISGTVNTSHHQAVDTVGKGLRVAVRASDGIIEALEWQDHSQHPFFVGVQWHPERMDDIDNPFALNILSRFVEELQHVAQPTGRSKLTP